MRLSSRSRAVARAPERRPGMEVSTDERAHLRPRNTLRVPEAAAASRILDPDRRLPGLLLPDLRAELRIGEGGGIGLARHLPDRDLWCIRRDRGVAFLLRSRRGHRARAGMDAPQAGDADAADGLL